MKIFLQREIAFDKTQIAKSQREKMQYLKVVLEKVQIAKTGVETILNSQYRKYNVILLC